MESTGIYWKSSYAALEAVGISAKVVNARHVKNVPGRKTDRVGDYRGRIVPVCMKMSFMRSSAYPHPTGRVNTFRYRRDGPAQYAPMRRSAHNPPLTHRDDKGAAANRSPKDTTSVPS